MSLPSNITATDDIASICEKCELLFPVVPSTAFRNLLHTFSSYITPAHFIVHATKGFDIAVDLDNLGKHDTLTRSDIHTMSEVIQQETNATRIGCLSGPNLASEILQGKPAATVISSPFTEVVNKAQSVLQSNHFHVFGSHEMLGAELAGALKNAIAIGSGILGGMELGKNIQAMLITRGLFEMIYLGKAMGSDTSPFLGTAGIGDLVATATSEKSRNYSFGLRIGRGEKLRDIMKDMPELAEGVRTIKIATKLSQFYKIKAPIILMLYYVVYEDFDVNKAITYLMTYPYDVDVDIL